MHKRSTCGSRSVRKTGATQCSSYFNEACLCRPTCKGLDLGTHASKTVLRCRGATTRRHLEAGKAFYTRDRRCIAPALRAQGFRVEPRDRRSRAAGPRVWSLELRPEVRRGHALLWWIDLRQ